ncbi:putative PI-PLC X domain-containing protein 3 [Penaeus vannamei]|uniref:Putative PI-PLC X domain-containing protein 3 n=1 Tax=Penaeus vannamei TaxID=6689 RepID=A0A3R7LZI2_PENVA|nr:putative PI-PLC X domain-containing protein 3 [Penaeus vannamei]
MAAPETTKLKCHTQGSHDSFSYSLTPEEELGPDAPGLVSALNSCCPCLARPAILRWSVTQRATTTQQLKHGVRYFDIRVAIRHFLVKHPGEVVFLDFQHLHGLANTDHASLVTLLRNTFSELICPFFHQLNHLSLAYLARFKYQVSVFYNFSLPGLRFLQLPPLPSSPHLVTYNFSSPPRFFSTPLPLTTHTILRKALVFYNLPPPPQFLISTISPPNPTLIGLLVFYSLSQPHSSGLSFLQFLPLLQTGPSFNIIPRPLLT